jgi:hypothetical protein
MGRIYTDGLERKPQLIEMTHGLRGLCHGDMGAVGSDLDRCHTVGRGSDA